MEEKGVDARNWKCRQGRKEEWREREREREEIYTHSRVKREEKK
jgi:hypothetical protein